MVGERLFQFAHNGDEAGLRRRLEDDDVDVNAKDDDGLSPLLVAVREGHGVIVRLLLKADADTEDQDSDGNTALLLAIVKKRRDIVRLLLRYDADIESSDDRGRTALLVAATVGDDVVVRILLNKDADIRAIDDDGKTALMLAEALGYPQIVQLLQPKNLQTQSTSQFQSQPQYQSREGLGREAQPDARDESSTTGTPPGQYQDAREREGFRPNSRNRANMSPPPQKPSQGDSLTLWRQGSTVFSDMLRGHTDRVTDMVFSSSERLLATGSWDQTINILKPNTRQLLKTFKCGPSRVEALAFTPDDQFLAAALQGSADNIRIWNVNTGDQVKALRDPSSVYSVAFSPCGTLLASGCGSSNPTVKLWRWETGQQYLSLEGHTAAVMKVLFSPDGQWIASASQDKTIKLWNPNTGELIGTLEGHSGIVNSLAISRNAQWLASASSDSTVRIWRTGTGAAKCTSKFNTGFSESLDFSSDGQLLAIALLSGTVIVLETATGDMVRSLSMKNAGTNFFVVAFAWDDTLIASGSDNGAVSVWLLPRLRN